MLKARFKIDAIIIAHAIKRVAATLDAAPSTMLLTESHGGYTTIVASAQIIMLVIGEVANMGESGLQFAGEI